MKGKTLMLTNYLIALFIILSLNFGLPRLLPGDPLIAIYGADAHVQMTEELQARLEERFALNESTGEQFVRYVTGLATGDLGYSFYYNAPVLDVVLSSLPWTLLLAGSAMFFSTLLGSCWALSQAGIEAAVKMWPCFRGLCY